jgi:thiol:disulfide interchange protein
MIARVRLACLFVATASALGCSLLAPPRVPQPTVSEGAADESPAPESFSLLVLHPSQGDLPSLLATYAQRAADLDRRPFVEFSADWCSSCVLLERSLKDPRMVEAFRGVYLIRLDFDEWEDQLRDTQFVVVGVPTFFELDSEGASTGRTLTGAAWGADVPENMAPVLQDFFRGGSP